MSHWSKDVCPWLYSTSQEVRLVGFLNEVSLPSITHGFSITHSWHEDVLMGRSTPHTAGSHTSTKQPCLPLEKHWHHILSSQIRGGSIIQDKWHWHSQARCYPYDQQHD